jgi:hypothetical protein
MEQNFSGRKKLKKERVFRIFSDTPLSFFLPGKGG